MIRYTIHIIEPHSHLVDVAVRLAPEGAAELELALPAWSPGSYLVRDYARNLRAFSACDAHTGATLACRKRDKQTFIVEPAGASEITFRYQVYAHELTVRTSHVDGQHAFLHGPSLLVYAVGRTQEPCTLSVAVPAGWQVATTLPRGEGGFVASDYDHLVDTPVELARVLDRIPFSVREVPHEITICGRADGPFDRDVLARDVAAIVSSAADLFGGLPYERYLFLLHLAGGVGQGGLEHRDSAALLATPSAFRPQKRYDELLELFAHEHFHAWNVKRIRPRALGPFDYSRENYTRSLWMMEGITSFYDRHLLVRAKLLTPARYLERLGEELARLRQTPGRLTQSLEEASQDAWIKFYRPDEATPNSTISYYLKGSLVAFALDLHVRAASDGSRSLDDVMRLLWARYGQAATGFDDSDAQALCEEATGLVLGDFFAAYVRGTTELDLERFVALLGLRVELLPIDPNAGEGAWLGVQTRELPGSRPQVAVTLAGGPAEVAGLYPGDELVALDGFRIDERSWRERLATRRPGDRARFTVFRRDELLDVELTLGARPPETYAFRPNPEASSADKALYASFFGEPGPDPTSKPNV
jgi:predicted metalloprotease with PDZ domain